MVERCRGLMRASVYRVLLLATLAITLSASAALTASTESKAHGGGSPPGFGVVCSPEVRTGSFDPIMDMRDIHDHIFFGATNINVHSTGATLRQAPQTSCAFSADRAGYWTPKPLNTGIQTQVNYYKPNPLNDKGNYAVFPKNLEMIAGGVPQDGNTTPSPHVLFGCQGEVGDSERPIDCGSIRSKLEVIFPDCVERDSGGNVIQESANGRSHVYYSDRSGSCGGNALKIPQLHQHFIYYETDGTKINWSVPFYDLHADFINGWNQSTLRKVIDGCIVAQRSGCQRITS